MTSKEANKYYAQQQYPKSIKRLLDTNGDCIHIPCHFCPLHCYDTDYTLDKECILEQAQQWILDNPGIMLEDLL